MKEICMSGWIAMDEIEIAPNFHLEEPSRDFYETYGGTVGYWESKGPVFSVDKKLFPHIHWESKPYKTQIIIKTAN